MLIYLIEVGLMTILFAKNKYLNISMFCLNDDISNQSYRSMLIEIEDIFKNLTASSIYLSLIFIQNDANYAVFSKLPSILISSQFHQFIL